MTEPASPASESSKAVPVGEPPTPEGVEAAAKTLWDESERQWAAHHGRGAEPWAEVEDVTREQFRDGARKALVAAAGVGGTGVRQLREALERIEFLTARSGQTFQEKINQIAREALAASVGEGDENGR